MKQDEYDTDDAQVDEATIMDWIGHKSVAYILVSECTHIAKPENEKLKELSQCIERIITSYDTEKRRSGWQFGHCNRYNELDFVLK